jgi:general stress protein CsbA
MNKPVIKKTIVFGLGYVTIKWLVILIIGGALYQSGYWNNWYLIAIPIIGITTFLIRRKINVKKNKT